MKLADTTLRKTQWAVALLFLGLSVGFYAGISIAGYLLERPVTIIVKAPAAPLITYPMMYYGKQPVWSFDSDIYTRTVYQLKNPADGGWTIRCISMNETTGVVEPVYGNKDCWPEERKP